jgi:hypothetical protein
MLLSLASTTSSARMKQLPVSRLAAARRCSSPGVVAGLELSHRFGIADEDRHQITA